MTARQREAFADQIRHACRASGHSQSEMAIQAGVSAAAFSKFLNPVSETGKPNWIGEEALNRLAEFLGLRVERGKAKKIKR